MPTNKDIAIRHGINSERIVATFYKNTKVQEDGCIVWTKMIAKNGYGTMGINIIANSGKRVITPVYVHRFAWALKFGMESLPIGMGPTPGDKLTLNHLCYNPACVNTNHLEVILQSLNSSPEKKNPEKKKRKPNDTIVADNLEDFMEQIRNTERE